VPSYPLKPLLGVSIGGGRLISVLTKDGFPGVFKPLWVKLIPLDFDGNHSVLRESSVYHHEPSLVDFIGSMYFFSDYSFASKDPE
jgi:hypothetical protein